MQSFHPPRFEDKIDNSVSIFLSLFFVTVKMKYIIIFLYLWTLTQSLQINNFNDGTNLLFIKSQNISIPDSYKTVEITLNMKNFLYETTILTYNINNITEICKQTTSNLHCNYFNGYVQRNVNKLTYEKERLFRILKVKRDITDIFTFLKYFFHCICNLDQNTINQLQETDKENRNFTSEHIKIDNDTLLMHKNFLNYIAKDIFSANKNIQKIRTTNAKLEKEIEINTMTMLTILSIDEHLKKVNQVSRILIYKETNDIFDIINLEEITTIISEFNETLKNNQKFLADNIIDIINTGKLETSTTNETIIINIQIPIEIIDMHYEAYKIIPIPFKGKDSDSLYRLKSMNSYIIFNKKEIFTSNQYKLKTCKTTANTNLICNIEEIHDGNNECEISVFQNTKPRNCILEKFHAIAYVTKIQSDTFYCVINRNLEFTLTCRDNITSYELLRNSWFTVEDDCFINITGHIYYTSSQKLKREITILAHNSYNMIIDAKEISNKFSNIHRRQCIAHFRTLYQY